MTGLNRVEFDATLEEFADVYLRLAERTAAYRQQRSQSQRAAGAFVGVVCVAAVAMRGQAGPAALAIASGAGLVAAFLVGHFYGRFYDRYVRDHYQRMVREMYGGDGPVRCEFELREDVLWTKTRDVELSFPWSRLTQLNDVDGSIEFWFDPGLAVVRDRAFRLKEHRDEFLERARRLGSRKAV